MVIEALNRLVGLYVLMGPSVDAEPDGAVWHIPGSEQKFLPFILIHDDVGCMGVKTSTGVYSVRP